MRSPPPWRRPGKMEPTATAAQPGPRRLRQVHVALADACSASTAPPPPPPPAQPLPTAALKKFIVDGVCVLNPPDLDPALHRAIYSRCKQRWFAADEAGRDALTRDMFPEVPELVEVVRSPTVRGALAAILGEGYVQHPHRSAPQPQLRSRPNAGNSDRQRCAGRCTSGSTRAILMARGSGATRTSTPMTTATPRALSTSPAGLSHSTTRPSPRCVQRSLAAAPSKLGCRA